jgi:prepilin-type N-terminal cleavage/methylation domain-containing protein
METSQSLTSSSTDRGFTLIETLVAMSILAIGLSTLALLTARMLQGTAQAHYFSLASQLASEKLEDLNRFPATDPNVAIPTGTTAGGISSDVVATVTSGGITEPVNYFDEVHLAVAGGSVAEVESGLDGSGATVYETIQHRPDGSVSTTTSTSVPTSPGTIMFKRRWIIEKDQPAVGVRRITVLVILENPVDTPVEYQMSMVRP